VAQPHYCLTDSKSPRRQKNENRHRKNLDDYSDSWHTQWCLYILTNMGKPYISEIFLRGFIMLCRNVNNKIDILYWPHPTNLNTISNVFRLHLVPYSVGHRFNC
jgi:hypothetical protein